MGSPSAVAALIEAFFIGEHALAQVYWCGDTKFSFTRMDNRMSNCFYQWVLYEIECPKCTWLTIEQRGGNTSWLRNSRISHKGKFLFTSNIGTSETSEACDQLLKNIVLQKSLKNQVGYLK